MVCPLYGLGGMVKASARHHITLILTAIYLVIVMGSLAPLALHSPVIAHALTGECAEDCRVCGCSPERSASQTCCCWQKKLKKDAAAKQQEAQSGGCCKKKNRTPRVTISECPCGSGKLIAFSGADNDELLPYHFNGSIMTHYEPIRAQNPPRHLTDRHVAPPDPPPKLA